MPIATAAMMTMAPTVMGAVFMYECSSDRTRCHGSVPAPSINYHALGKNLTMPLTVVWIALGMAAFLAAGFALDRRKRSARLTTLRAEWGYAPERVRDMVAIGAFATRAPSDSALDDPRGKT
jgi:hypothetical protein